MFGRGGGEVGELVTEALCDGAVALKGQVLCALGLGAEVDEVGV